MIRIQFCIKSRGYTLLMYGMITYRHYSNKLKVFWDAHKTCTNHEENRQCNNDTKYCAATCTCVGQETDEENGD